MTNDTVTTTTAAPATRPALDPDAFNVWVSTFGLYNAGALLGYWVAASDAPETIDEFVDGLAARGLSLGRYADEVGEELHCFDVENFPGTPREVSPAEALELAAILDRIDAPADVLGAYLDNGNDFDDDTPDRLEESYRGTFDSLEDYVSEFLDDAGMLAELPEWARSHASALVDSMAHDMRLGGEVWTASVDGGTAVFLSL